ncbi:MAG: hypothetical protein B6I20_12955 [Bacteroidetes bacterium 4572_117]|nr:MAG: hypothetical protein B6I20_12955 [Bacteroidetes bacterium 4572_117]
MKNLLLSTLTIYLVSICSCNKNSDSGISQSAYDKEIFNLINAHRQSIGLASLEYNDEIWKGAYGHSKNMADGTVDFGHVGFSERVSGIRTNMGLAGGSSSENVAMGYSSANAVVSGWLNSTGHKDNIEGDFTYSAVSAVKSENGQYYYTQIFIRE